MPGGPTNKIRHLGDLCRETKGFQSLDLCIGQRPKPVFPIETPWRATSLVPRAIRSGTPGTLAPQCRSCDSPDLPRFLSVTYGTCGPHSAEKRKAGRHSLVRMVGNALSHLYPKTRCFQLRPRAIAEKSGPHRGAGDAWRAHHENHGLRELWREAKGLESLGAGHRSRCSHIDARVVGKVYSPAPAHPPPAGPENHNCLISLFTLLHGMNIACSV